LLALLEPDRVLLLAQVDMPGRAGDEEAAALAEVFRGAGALWAEQSTDELEAEVLFVSRRLAYPALERLGPLLTEDVRVPRSKVQAMLAAIQDIAERHDTSISPPREIQFVPGIPLRPCH